MEIELNQQNWRLRQFVGLLLEFDVARVYEFGEYYNVDVDMQTALQAYDFLKIELNQQMWRHFVRLLLKLNVRRVDLFDEYYYVDVDMNTLQAEFLGKQQTLCLRHFVR